jgi:hypothetical protein
VDGKSQLDFLFAFLANNDLDFWRALARIDLFVSTATWRIPRPETCSLFLCYASRMLTNASFGT